MRKRCWHPRVPALAALLLGALCASTAPAQQLDSLRRHYRLPDLPLHRVAAPGVEVAPGLSIGAPTALGADYGFGFVGVGYQHTTRWGRDSDPDGGAVLGFGLGDADRLVGLEVALSSFGTARTCCRGGASFKLHRRFAGSTALAAGWENAAHWGYSGDIGAATDAGSSVYLVATRGFALRPGYTLSRLTLSLGVGSGRFRRESDIRADRERANVFGSASLRLARPAAAIVDWTGQDLIAGLSLVPFPHVPLVITPAVADLTHEPRFIVGAGVGFDYRSLF